MNMKNQSILVRGILFALCMLPFAMAWSQGKNADELKAEREALRSEMRSESAQKRAEKYDKLNPPSASGVNSVDELARNSTKMLSGSKEVSLTVPEMFKRTIGETVDGVTDVTVKKPTMEELLTLARAIGMQITAVRDANKAVEGATADAKSASPLQAPKATKSLNYSKDVLALIGPELEMNLRVVNHLVATLESSKNY